jgi:hypothetical protein
MVKGKFIGIAWKNAKAPPNRRWGFKCAKCKKVIFAYNSKQLDKRIKEHFEKEHP